MTRRAGRARFRRNRRTSRKRSYRRAMGTGGPAARTRMRRTRYRPELGDTPNKTIVRKHNMYNSTPGIPGDKALSSIRLVNCRWSSDTTKMNRRNGRLCNVHGVKFRAWFELRSAANTSDFYEHPLQVRWAVINPKNNTGSTLDITTGNNFFVATNPNQDDADDFIAGTSTTGARCFDYMNRKINGRSYGVLQEGTFLLSQNPASTSTGAQGRMSIGAKKFISVYVPLGVQMKWGGTGDDSIDAGYPNANVHFVYWFCKQGDQADAATWTTIDSGPIAVAFEHCTYFNNAAAVG